MDNEGNALQAFIHRLEVGVWARSLRFVLLAVCILVLTILFISRFHGLSSAVGMEQAEIARELARGNGFSTKFIRPLAVWQFQTGKGAFPSGNIPDAYQAPLNPFINSLFLRLRPDALEMLPKQMLFPLDTLIAEVSIALFLLALAINYFTARRLFGPRLALLGVGLLVVCNSFWQFALSGLPQMLMLCLFSACLYTQARALEAGAGGRTAGWAAAEGALFGLLALTHGLTLWIFAGALVYTALRRQWRHALLMLGACGIVYAPWLWRNYQVCGNPFGLAGYSFLGGLPLSESLVMRSPAPVTDGLGPATLAGKMKSQFSFQLERLYPLLGASAVAPLFFVSLLHPFKRPEAASFRWRLLAMGIGAILGMAAFGLSDEAAQANNLSILFVPFFTFYGLAFALSLVRRIGMRSPLFRIETLCVIYLVSAFPLFNAMFQKANRALFHWPPYVPPSICRFNKWIKEDEVIVSDMPWAVAWYADRKCLWLPASVEDFVRLNDSKALGGPLVGLYLTPVSDDVPYRSEIARGEFTGWAPLILGLSRPSNFPLRVGTRLPPNKECLFYSDRNRWSEAGK